MRALLVDSDGRCRSKLDQWIRPLGFDPATQAETLETAVAVLEKRDFDLVITALELPDGSGMDVLQKCRPKGIKVLVMSGHFDTRTVTSILRVEGNELLEKPLQRASCQRAVRQLLGSESPPTPDTEKSALLAQSEPLDEPRSVALPVGPEEIVGTCPELNAILESLLKVADTDAEVLILGESGTGKEVIARAVHIASHRAQRPFVAVNAAAVPEMLLESELFGHTRGAFTGAQAKRKGLIAAAEGGTLFLDEIGEMPMGQQAKLLRVLQEKTYTPVGSDREHRADVRVVAATNANLLEQVQKKKFRADLYYRLNVFPLHLPPLRDRGQDILLLAQHFIGRSNAKRRRAVDGIAPELEALFLSYYWPGNVRQLENVIDRLVIEVGKGQLELKALPADLRTTLESNSDASPDPPLDESQSIVRLLANLIQPSERAGPSVPQQETVSAITTTDPMGFLDGAELPEGGLELRDFLVALEYRFIDQALSRSDGNRNRAAQLLGLKRTTLVEKLRKRG